MNPSFGQLHKIKVDFDNYMYIAIAFSNKFDFIIFNSFIMRAT